MKEPMNLTTHYSHFAILRLIYDTIFACHYIRGELVSETLDIHQICIKFSKPQG